MSIEGIPLPTDPRFMAVHLQALSATMHAILSSPGMGHAVREVFLMAEAASDKLLPSAMTDEEILVFRKLLLSFVLPPESLRAMAQKPAS